MKGLAVLSDVCHRDCFLHSEGTSCWLLASLTCPHVALVQGNKSPFQQRTLPKGSSEGSLEPLFQKTPLSPQGPQILCTPGHSLGFLCPESIQLDSGISRKVVPSPREGSSAYAVSCPCLGAVEMLPAASNSSPAAQPKIIPQLHRADLSAPLLLRSESPAACQLELETGFFPPS